MFMNQNSIEFVCARITENKDPEKKGRVQVRYHWAGQKSGQQSTFWARVAQPFCNSEKGGGFWALPDVGDEVIIGFENGHTESPIVIGSLSQPQKPPPKSGLAGDGNENGENNLKFIRTNSGHLLAFDDLKGQEKIILQDKDKNSFVIKTSEGTVEIFDKNNNKVTLNSKGITIQSSSKVVIEEAQGIELGKGAAESLVLGDKFKKYFETHTHPTGVGPSGPPTQPMTPDLLSKKVKSV